MSAKFYAQDGIRLAHLREFVEATAGYPAETGVIVGVLKTTCTYAYSQPYTVETRPVVGGDPK